MLKPLKHRIGFWILISLIPAAILFVLGFMIGFYNEFTRSDSELAAQIAAFCLLHIVWALPTGLVLLIWGNVEFNRAYRVARQYAERHGWLPISRTNWRNRKGSNVTLAVSQAFQKRTYLLMIEGDGETITIDEFESALWALQFGDWLWRELLIDNAAPNREDIEEKRVEWETTALVPSNR